jgi:drug/metabolite transporter (DMT)-like permease
VTTAAIDGPTAAAAGRPGLGTGAAVLAVAVWGSSSVLIKEIEALDGVAITAYRLWIGAVVTTVIYVAAGGRLTWSLLRRCTLGSVMYTADMVFFFCAIRETSVVNATIIGALQPLLLVGVSGPLFGERPARRDVLWGVVALVGVGIVVGGGDAGGAASVGGDLLAVAALVAWTGYFIASKSARVGLGSFEYLTGISLVAAVLIVPVALLVSAPLGTPTTTDWWYLLVIAVVNGAVGHFLMNWAHGHITLVATSLLTLGIPVVSAASAAVLLDEPVSALQVLGMVVVLGALAVVAAHGARQQQRTRLTAAPTSPAPEA